METVTGILPFLIKLVECPGHGQEKKELVKNAMLAILDKIGAQIINLAREHQTGRAPKIGAFATFDFTEGWFRNSGLYDLCEKYQLALIEVFIADKCKWNNAKVQKEAAKYKRWQEYIELAKETRGINSLPFYFQKTKQKHKNIIPLKKNKFI